MALWHYKFCLVPRPTKEPKTKQLSDEGFIPEIEEDWSWMETGIRLQKIIAANFSDTESWSEEILMYGYDGHRIDIGLIEETTDIEFVQVRLDLTQESWKEFLDKLLEVCGALPVRIYDFYSYEIYDAIEANILNSIPKSNAFRFLTDPHGYLDSFNNSDRT